MVIQLELDNIKLIIIGLIDTSLIDIHLLIGKKSRMVVNTAHFTIFSNNEFNQIID